MMRSCIQGDEVSEEMESRAFKSNKRCSAKEKEEIVLRLLRGEP